MKISKLLWLVSLGALFGGGVATWLGPKSIIWYFNPPVDMGFNCKAPITWALNRLILSQGVGLLAGAVVGLSLFFVIGRRKRDSAISSEN